MPDRAGREAYGRTGRQEGTEQAESGQDPTPTTMAPQESDGDYSELDDDESEAMARGLLAASYAVAYEEQLKGNAISAMRRTWALRLILLALLLQAVAFVILPFHRGGF